MSFRKKAEVIDITTADVLEQLKEETAPGKISSMRKFGMTVENRLGVLMPDIRQIAREVGDDHQLALAL